MYDLLSYWLFKLLTTAADGSFAVWDMRPPPQKASMTGLKKRGQKEQEQKETDPYAHLNLFWKPILKANLQNGDSRVHNPTKISLPKFNGETIKEFLTFFHGYFAQNLSPTHFVSNIGHQHRFHLIFSDHVY